MAVFSADKEAPVRKKTRNRLFAAMLVIIGILAGILAFQTYWQTKKGTGTEERVSVGEQEGNTDGKTEPADEVHEEAEPGQEAEQKVEQETEQKMEQEPVGEQESGDTAARNILNSMTTEEKAAQIFFVTPEAITGVQTVTAAGDATKAALEKYPVGGLVYFSANLISPEQTRTMLANTWAYSQEVMKVPVYLGVDEEGGTVARVASNPAFSVTQYQGMRAIGDTGDPSQAYQAAQTISSYLKDLGFNMDFAPDADVITNPENKVIGNRSFGTDPQLVGDMVSAAVKGFRDQAMASCIKHFPGHGGTKGDTHEGYAYTDRTVEQMESAELLPFRSGIEAGVEFIMASHISAPNTPAGDTPASLSSYMLTDLLRELMGYQGLVITDAMNMGAISQQYSSAQAAVQAFQAGADMILMPENFTEAYNGILQAVQSGQITQERLDTSVLRILETKLEKFEKNP